MRILIVDDEPHILSDLGNELKSVYQEVDTASSIKEAKDKILKGNFNSAIIDLKLDFTSEYAGYGGIEVFKFAKKNQPKIRSFICSAYPFEHLKESLKKQSSNLEESEILLGEIECDYIYKGNEINYIEAIFDKLGIEDTVTDSSWYGEYHALLFAVQNYKDRRINNLDYPIKDAKKLRTVLNSKYKFKHIEILEDPDRQNIISKLHELSKQLVLSDNLLVFYAGHGCWDDERQQGYWLPSDAKKENPAQWISNGDIRDFIRGIKTQHTLIISDACFSGAIFKSRSESSSYRTLKEKYHLRSRRAITSGDATQSVPDRSIFLEFLLQRLIDNRDQYYYAEKLYVNIYDNFIHSNLSSQNPVYGKIQNAGDEVGGDFILIKS